MCYLFLQMTASVEDESGEIVVIDILVHGHTFFGVVKEERMAGRRWFARDDVASMGWGCLIIFAIGGCRGVLAADSAAMEPSAAVARGEEGGCYRPLSDVIWGFLVTLLAFIVSEWGVWKETDGFSKSDSVVVAAFCPLLGLFRIVHQSLRCVSFLWTCHGMEYPNSPFMSRSWLKFLCSSLLPWSKSPARILASCDIVVYVSKESPLLESKWLWNPTCSVVDESEAMVVGENGARAIRNDHYERMELSAEGVALLVWKEVFSKANDCKRLPKYDELKYLRGKSGFAVMALAVQAFGYIYAVGFWVAKNLRISPLEVIGVVLNSMLLIKVVFHCTCNPCHRPLVIYMDADWELEFGNFNDEVLRKFPLKYSGKVELGIRFGVAVVLSPSLIYGNFNVVKVTNVKFASPLILFLIGLWSLLFAFTFGAMNCKIPTRVFNYITILANILSTAEAITGTMAYWKTMHFNTRGDLPELSQIIPFIG